MHQTTGVLPNKSFVFNQTLKKSTGEDLFKQNNTKQIKLDIKKVTLLENYYTIEIFYNSDLVENITKAKKKMTVQGNGGTL